MIVNRRDFIRAAALGTAGVWAHAQIGDYMLAQPSRQSTLPLLKEVEAVCHRLGSHGWRELMLDVSSGELDIMARNLSRELTKRLPRINRGSPGFEDFASEGERAIEPGNPGYSLLFHALASPAVTQNASGRPLTQLPTPGEIEVIENFVYGVHPPSFEDLRVRSNGAPLALVVFSSEYRTVSHTVHRKHADMCFSRSAFARAGTMAAKYDGRRRGFLPLVADDPFGFRVQPARYSAYIAMQCAGRQDSFGPMRFQREDETRKFWVPLHKLFTGRDCIKGRNLNVTFSAHYINEKLRRFHQFMANESHNTGWKEPDIDNFPFVLKDDIIADFSSQVEHGVGLIMPKPHPLFEKATYRGKPLGFDVPPGYSAATGNTWFSSLQILPVPESASDTTTIEGSLFGDGIAYADGLNPTVGRHAPEYLNTRHKLLADGSEIDLNDMPDVLEQVIAGGYRAQHYIDYTADGWVAAACPQLPEIRENLPAYSAVSPPDFFPAILQRELMEWWERDSPPAIRSGLWCIPPLALSDRRMAANIHLRGARFSIADDTVTTIVSQPLRNVREPRPAPSNETSPLTRLPDGSNGVFDPGWDVSQDTDNNGALFLQNYGLGTPFIEDVKLCAALGSFWPAVAPDATRTFQPNKEPQGTPWPWPTIVPLTDEEIGTVEVKGGGLYPWDGVIGPKIVIQDEQELVHYPNINHVDYINLAGKLTAFLTSRIDLKEYQARVLAMASVYKLLGLHDSDFLRRYKSEENALNRLHLARSRWVVVSFLKAGDSVAELKSAEQATQVNLQVNQGYRFHVCRHGKQQVDPKDFKKLLVEMQDQVLLYVDGINALLKYKGGRWLHEKLTST